MTIGSFTAAYLICFRGIRIFGDPVPLFVERVLWVSYALGAAILWATTPFYGLDGLPWQYNVPIYSVCVSFLVMLYYLQQTTKSDTASTPAPQPTPADEWVHAVVQNLTVPTPLIPPITEVLARFFSSFPPDQLPKKLPYHHSDLKYLAGDINWLASVLPDKQLLQIKGTGSTWESYYHRRMMDYDPKAYIDNILSSAHARIPPDLMDIRVGVAIPEKLRTEHMMVVGGSGSGKSQLFQSLILDDLDSPAAIIVIDSQNDLINKLATRIDPSRLILIDAIAAPPALNIFKLGNPGLLEYVFGALEAQMTSQQGMVYRYLCRHVMRIDGNITDLLDALHNPEQPFVPHNEAAKVFFAEYAKPKGQYREVREQISRRVVTLLENDTFDKMLSAPNLAIDIPDAIEKGKVVLINTAKADVGGPGAALFGRFWLSLVLTKVMAGSRMPVRLYVDEFADYASDELETLFTQARKYNLAMTCAFQSLAQLPTKLQAIMVTNTAIKLASGVSAEDRSNLARQMDVDASFIAGAKKGTFAAWFRDIGTAYYSVEMGRLERLPEVEKLSDIHARMRKRYGPSSRVDERPSHSPSPPPVSPKKPDSEPPKREGKGFIVDD